MTIVLLASILASPFVQSPEDQVAHIIDYRGGAVRCGGEVVQPVFTTEPLPTSAYLREQAAPPFTVAFRIGADGRPIGIREPVRAAGQFGYVQTDDLAPTLAAWRFAPGRERSECTISFQPTSVTVAEAPLDTLYRFVVLPRLAWPGWEEAKKRAADTGGTCFRPRHPAVLLQGMPDFERIPQPSSSYSWSMIGFDIDKSGRPVRVRTLASDGNAALDRAGLDAIKKSRYAAGSPRTGCNYPFHHRQNTPVAAPEAPPRDERSPTCDRMLKAATLPKLVFPPPYRRRAIEGWADVQYDVAPWGVTGNFKVLRAEPAALFGERATAIIAQTKYAPSPTGASGCVDRVRFKLPAADQEAEPAPPVPPPVY